MRKLIHAIDGNRTDQPNFDSAVKVSGVLFSDTALAYPRGLKYAYIFYDEIDWCFERVRQGITRICCGRMTYDVELLVIKLKNGEEIEIDFNTQMGKMVDPVIEKIGEMAPEIAIGYTLENKERFGVAE